MDRRGFFRSALGCLGSGTVAIPVAVPLLQMIDVRRADASVRRVSQAIDKQRDWMINEFPKMVRKFRADMEAADKIKRESFLRNSG